MADRAHLVFQRKLIEALKEVSAQRLGEKAGLSRQTIYDYRDGAVPSLEKAEAIASALGRSLTEMVSEEAPDHPIEECHRRVGDRLKRYDSLLRRLVTAEADPGLAATFRKVLQKIRGTT